LQTRTQLLEHIAELWRSGDIGALMRFSFITVLDIRTRRLIGSKLNHLLEVGISKDCPKFW